MPGPTHDHPHEPEREAAAPQARAAQGAGVERVLALQRAAGNRATTQELQRWPEWLDKIFGGKSKPKFPTTVSIGDEQVVINSDAEQTDAARIIKEMPEKYGIEVSSARSMKALKSRTGSAPESLKKKIRTWPWLYKELRACERAIKHYAPILGAQRKGSTRKDVDQEVISIGKGESKLKNIGGKWQFSESVIGEYYSEADLRAFTMYKHGEDSTVDFPDVDKQLEATAVHEMAHGIFQASYDRWVTQFSFWLNQDTASGTADVEAPPTDYGKTNAREDLAESVMLYFVDKERLKKGNGATKGKPGNPCPDRCAFIATLVGEWEPTPPVGDFPTPDKTTVIA